VAIGGVRDLTLKTILFTIAWMEGSDSLHMYLHMDELLPVHHGMHGTSYVQLVRWTPPQYEESIDQAK
jgi:hypothetical protein